MFSTYKPRILTTSNNDFTTCHIKVQTSVVKKVCLSFSLVPISYSENSFYPAYSEF